MTRYIIAGATALIVAGGVLFAGSTAEAASCSRPGQGSCGHNGTGEVAPRGPILGAKPQNGVCALYAARFPQFCP